MTPEQIAAFGAGVAIHENGSVAAAIEDISNRWASALAEGAPVQHLAYFDHVLSVLGRAERATTQQQGSDNQGENNYGSNA